MRKSKSQISVINNAGYRRNADIIVGEPHGHTSGDILDANAVQELVGNSTSLPETYLGSFFRPA